MDKYCAECVKISMGNEEIIDCTKIEYIADEVHRDKEYDNIDSTEQDKADYAKEYDVKLEKFTKWFIKVDPKHCHGKYTVQLSEDVNDIEKMCMSHFFDKYNFYSTIKILNDNVGEDHDCTSYADYVSDMQTKYRFYLCKHCNERGYFKNPSICFQNKGVCDTCWFIQTNKN